MPEIPKLILPSSSGFGEAVESEQRSMMGTQRISLSDHTNTFQYTAEKNDSFVIDMDAFSPGINKDSPNANSRITRSLSRKGSQRWCDRKVNGNATLHDMDAVPSILFSPTGFGSLCSPKGTLVAGPCTPEKPAVGSTDHSISPHVHHQITITANNTTTESKCITRRNSFRRSSNSWGLDPKRVLLFFATLSSMGTMLLIYFTLAVNKQNADELGGDWKQ